MPSEPRGAAFQIKTVIVLLQFCVVGDRDETIDDLFMVQHVILTEGRRPLLAFTTPPV